MKLWIPAASAVHELQHCWKKKTPSIFAQYLFRCCQYKYKLPKLPCSYVSKLRYFLLLCFRTLTTLTDISLWEWKYLFLVCLVGCFFPLLIWEREAVTECKSQKLEFYNTFGNYLYIIIVNVYVTHGFTNKRTPNNETITAFCRNMSPSHNSCEEGKGIKEEEN